MEKNQRLSLFLCHTAIILLIMVLGGCSALKKAERQENRVVRKIEKLKKKYPEAWDSVTVVTVRIDTVIKEIHLEGKTEIDTVKVTEVLKEFKIDTVEIPRLITRFLEATKEVVNIDSLDIHLWIEGSGMSYRLKRDSSHIVKEARIETVTLTKTEVVRKRFYQDWLFWVVFILGTAIILLIKSNKISIKIPKS